MKGEVEVQGKTFDFDTKKEEEDNKRGKGNQRQGKREIPANVLAPRRGRKKGIPRSKKL